MSLTDDIRMAADELRAIASMGLRWTDDLPHDADRYRHVLRVAARLWSLTDDRSSDEIERTVFHQLSHLAPMPVGEAAVFDDADRILLIRRADDGLWAMPGGGFEVGETPAEGAAREAREEAGAEIDITDLIGVYDSRFCDTPSSIQLYMFVFHARLIEQRDEWITTPHEVTAVDWFRSDRLPPLSRGHSVRVPHAFSFHRRPGRAVFDHTSSTDGSGHTHRHADGVPANRSAMPPGADTGRLSASSPPRDR